jgi:hypothetical protein
MPIYSANNFKLQLIKEKWNIFKTCQQKMTQEYTSLII